MKKVLLIAAGFVVGAASVLVASKAFSAGGDFGSLDFAAYQGYFTFFDKSSGTVYVYSNSAGTLTSTWHMDELGKPLIKKRTDVFQGPQEYKVPSIE